MDYKGVLKKLVDNSFLYEKLETWVGELEDRHFEGTEVYETANERVGAALCRLLTEKVHKAFPKRKNGEVVYCGGQMFDWWEDEVSYQDLRWVLEFLREV